ncbi:MAG: alpha/beta fold hydrolase [Pseudomonadota bacterium]
MIIFIVLQSNCAGLNVSNTSETEEVVLDKSYRDIFSDTHDMKRPKTEKEGPFHVTSVKDQVFTLGPSDQISTDMFIPEQHGASPLIIIVHGNHYSKEMHLAQAEYLASWGMHVMTLNLPNENEWLLNGYRTKKMVSILRAVPTLVSPNVDISKIILVGHSFGGSAVTISAAQGAKVAGLVLLDPAVVSEEVYDYQMSIKVPVVLLGADRSIFQSRQRNTFSKNIKSPFFEVSISGAEHTDAQLPKSMPLFDFRLRSNQRVERRSLFKQLLLESAVSILEKDFSYLSESIHETSINSKIDVKLEHWNR